MTARLVIPALRILGGAFLLVAALCLVDPRWVLADMEVVLDTATALAEIRAAYGGALGGLGVLFIWGAAQAIHRRLALGVAAIVLGGFTVGRLLSLLLDGIPSHYALACLVAEGGGSLVFLWLWSGAPKYAPALSDAEPCVAREGSDGAGEASN